MIIKSDKEFFADYLTDASNFKGDASALFIPENIEELKEIVKKCYSENIPYTVSGAGTGLCGGRVPLSGVIISTEKLNKISPLKPETNTLWVESGVLFSDLEQELRQQGFFIPSNPTEKNSSVGGNIANNSSGAKTFKYGPYRNFVKAVRFILPDGNEILIKRGENRITNGRLLFSFPEGTREIEVVCPVYPNVKNASGFYFPEGGDLIDLIVGCEGSLGIVAEAELSPLPLPENVLGGIIFFDNEMKLLNFVKELRKTSRINNQRSVDECDDISARLIEFFDSNSLDLIRIKFPLIPIEAKGAIWIEQEFSSAFEDVLLSKWYDFISEFTSLADRAWLSDSETEHRKMEEFRHALPTAIYEKYTASGTNKIGTDSAVPENEFIDFYLRVKQKLESTGFEYYIWGHFGDCHLHANIISHNQDEYNNGMKFYQEVVDLALGCKGTISAEHGIGKLKRKYLLQMYGEDAINEMKKIKKFFDPKLLLNQGNLFL